MASLLVRAVPVLVLVLDMNPLARQAVRVVQLDKAAAQVEGTARMRAKEFEYARQIAIAPVPQASRADQANLVRDQPCRPHPLGRLVRIVAQVRSHLELPSSYDLRRVIAVHADICQDLAGVLGSLSVAAGLLRHREPMVSLLVRRVQLTRHRCSESRCMCENVSPRRSPTVPGSAELFRSGRLEQLELRLHRVCTNDCRGTPRV